MRLRNEYGLLLTNRSMRRVMRGLICVRETGTRSGQWILRVGYDGQEFGRLYEFQWSARRARRKEARRLVRVAYAEVGWWGEGATETHQLSNSSREEPQQLIANGRLVPVLPDMDAATIEAFLSVQYPFDRINYSKYPI